MVVNTMTLPGSFQVADKVADKTDSEHLLLQRIADGDDRAFTQLYSNYHPRLYRFVMRILNNPQMAEEVVSDTLFSVWKGAGSFKGKSKVSTWIFGIGYRTALKAIRSSSRHERFSGGDDELGSIADTAAGSDPAVLAENTDQTAQVLNAIKSLNPDQQAVVELTALGWSCQEIGEIVGCPSNTVKTRMFNARKKLFARRDAEQSLEKSEA